MLIPNWHPVRAICIKFPAVRLINFLKISKGRGSCRKLIVTVAILLWIIFLFNILCSTWFSLCCLPRFFFPCHLKVLLCFNSFSLCNCFFCWIHHLWSLFWGKDGQRTGTSALRVFILRFNCILNILRFLPQMVYFLTFYMTTISTTISTYKITLFCELQKYF